MKILRIQQQGSVLLSIVLILPFLILIAALYMEFSVSSLRLAREDQFHTYAQFATDAGIDVSLQEINEDASWTGTNGEVELFNDGQIKTTYQLTVDNPTTESKIVTAVGRTYSPATASTPSYTVTINVDLRPVTSGTYSVVTGVGGLILNNSAKILGGDVLVNGEIFMSNSAQIGLSNNPVNRIEVAHQNCPVPADANYPRICNPGENGQPITINNTAHIYGEVRANNQTNGAGMSNPGLVAGSGVSTQALPPHDRSAQKAAVATEISGTAASCSGSQTRTWTANTKINGNVSVSNNCIVTVEGNVWITGNLTTSNSSQVRVANSLGATRPTIMIDGANGAVFSNSTRLVSNSSGTGFQIITYRSSASCSPECANVTGTDLYNSRNTTTISLNNSAEGPNTVFYARWSRVQVNNSGQIGALVGQTVQINNSGTITFGASVGTSNTYWIIDGYRRSF